MMHFAITSLADIDFEGLVDASLPRMDAGTFIWPAGVETVAEKHAYLRRRAESILAQPNAFCYGCTVDGEDLAAIFGALNDGVMSGGFSLVRPDRNGSRAFIYRQDVLDSQRAFFAAHGVASLKAVVPKASPLVPGLNSRHNPAQIPAHPVVGDGYDGIEIRADN